MLQIQLFLIKISPTFCFLPIYYYLCRNFKFKKVMATDNMKIAVAGTGYVGLSIATLLSQHHQVVAVDVVPEKWNSSTTESHLSRTTI